MVKMRNGLNTDYLLENQSIILMEVGMHVPLDSGLGVDLLLVLCWEEVDSVLSSTLAEQLSSSTCFIHLCINTTSIAGQK